MPFALWKSNKIFLNVFQFYLLIQRLNGLDFPENRLQTANDRPVGFPNDYKSLFIFFFPFITHEICSVFGCYLYHYLTTVILPRNLDFLLKKEKKTVCVALPYRIMFSLYSVLIEMLLALKLINEITSFIKKKEEFFSLQIFAFNFQLKFIESQLF